MKTEEIVKVYEYIFLQPPIGCLELQRQKKKLEIKRSSSKITMTKFKGFEKKTFQSRQ